MLAFEELRPKEIVAPANLSATAIRLDVEDCHLAWMTSKVSKMDLGPIKTIEVLDLVDADGNSQKGFSYNCVPTTSGELLILKVFRLEDSEKAYERSMLQTDAAIPNHLALIHFMINSQGGLVQAASRDEYQNWALIVNVIHEGEPHA